MRTWLIALIALVGGAASAFAGTITCAVDLDLIPSNSYLVAGRLTLSNAYATGGELFGAASALADVGKCLCNSFARKPLVVLVEGEKNCTTCTVTAAGARIWEFNATTRRIQGFVPSTNAEIANNETTGGVVLRFTALCS